MLVTTKAQLIKEVQRRVAGAISKDIAPMMKSAIVSGANSEVYAAGEPVMYKRRFDDGGLIDLENMHLKIEYDGDSIIAKMHDDAPADWSGFDPLAPKLEHGYGEKDTWYNESRPFMSKAQELFGHEKDTVVAILDKAIKGR